MIFKRKSLPSGTTRRDSLYEALTASKLVAFATFFLGLTLAFYIFAPTKALQKRIAYEIESKNPVKIAIEDLRLLPLLTFKGRNLDIDFLTLEGYQVRLDSFSLDPWWSSLAQGKPGVECYASALGGVLIVRLNSGGDIAARASGLHLEVPLGVGPHMNLSSDVRIATMAGSLPLQDAVESLIEIELSNLKINGLTFLTAKNRELSLGQVKLLALGHKGSFQIEQLEATGGDIEVSGDGEFLLARNLQNSRINLNLILKVDSVKSPNLVDLISLAAKKQDDGSYHLRLSGTIAKTVLN